jgi:hypothetical protein
MALIAFIFHFGKEMLYKLSNRRTPVVRFRNIKYDAMLTPPPPPTRAVISWPDLLFAET